MYGSTWLILTLHRRLLLMQIVYARQPLPSGFRTSLYLAGPTPRDRSVPSWRPEALAILARLGYDGTVFVPEDEGWGLREDTFVPQVDWELAAMHRSDQIVFWIPRDLRVLTDVRAGESAERALRMPAFTTNVEFGFWLRDRERVVLGAPDSAHKNRYIETIAAPERFDLPVYRTLKATLVTAVARLGEGAFRTDGECGVPLHIWTTERFQRWYHAHRERGDTIVDARVEWTRAIQHGSTRVLLWTISAVVRDGRTGVDRRMVLVTCVEDNPRGVDVDEYVEATSP